MSVLVLLSECRSGVSVRSMSQPTPESTQYHLDPNPANVSRMPHCARCLYPLAGLSSDAPCPECGSVRRQNWPHRVVDDEVSTSVIFTALAVLSIIITVLGFWPGLLVAPVFALLAIVFGELSIRRRRRRQSNPSLIALLARCVAWGVISIYVSFLVVWVTLSIFPFL